MKRTPFWLWVAASFAILSAWLFFAAVMQAVVSSIVPADAAWATLLTDLSTFIPFFLATPLAWRYMLGRPIPALINFRGRVERRHIGVGFLAWFALCTVSTGIDAIIHPDGYTFTFSFAAFAPFALVTVLLLPIQTSAEEFFFRGWVLNWSSSLPRFSQVFISGLVFAWPHLGNPEAATDTALAFTAYFLLGAGWAYVSVRAGGIELALGAHLANNAFSLLAVGYDDAALPTQALFTTNQLDLVTTTISLAIMVPAFAWLTRRYTTVRAASSETISH